MWEVCPTLDVKKTESAYENIITLDQGFPNKAKWSPWGPLQKLKGA